MRSPELNFAGGCYASFLCSKSNLSNSAKLTRAACSNSPSSTTSRETRSPKFPHQLTRAACSNSPSSIDPSLILNLKKCAARSYTSRDGDDNA